MKKIVLLGLLAITTLITSCNKEEKSKFLHFATSAEYPPFEYIQRGEIQGFDIDLAKLVARELGKTAVFDNMQFSAVLPAITSGKSDAAISTLTITSERQQNVDFTTPYYSESMALVFKTKQPVKQVSDLNGKKLSAQLGSVMDIWLRKHFSAKDIHTFNNNNQAIEALLAGHIEVILMDSMQSSVYCLKHHELSSLSIGNAYSGYGIALKKGSPLKDSMNEALKRLNSRGEIAKLEKKWLGASWDR